MEVDRCSCSSPTQNSFIKYLKWIHHRNTPEWILGKQHGQGDNTVEHCELAARQGNLDRVTASPEGFMPAGRHNRDAVTVYRATTRLKSSFGRTQMDHLRYTGLNAQKRNRRTSIWEKDTFNCGSCARTANPVLCRVKGFATRGTDAAN